MIVDFIRSRVRSFGYAINGLVYVIRTQKNAWIHATATVLVTLLSFWLQLNARDWAVLILVVGIVWMAEFLNTALEAVVDLAIPHNHPLAKVGKDVGAAAVLIAAVSSVLIGFLVLGPPLWARVFNIK